ncbi:MAG: DNA primase [Candidatus Marinimicrobia bacterium]|nr:DNA primase [Candidatus Neomarinimicrobiota bacterium]
MGRIPQETIERVRDMADILDVVSQYVDMKKRGQNYFGICPFHHEKTASFSVAPAKGIYHCFGCGVGGSAINFLMEYEKISFVEAVQRLGERYGIEVLHTQDSESKELFTYLYELHEMAADLYLRTLFSEKGKTILAYLSDRGLTEETLKQFKIGLAPDSWNTLLKLADQKNIPKDAKNKSGLFSSSEKGTFDRFRNRIQFSIFNTAGRIIAFGGRAIDPNDPAKYMNSPETPLYHKSDVFYGLHASRNAIRRSGYAIIVEGYMDFLQLFQAGIQNVIAVSGTAMTERHVAQIQKFTNRVLLAYDGDSAGIQATLKAGYLLFKGGVEPLVVVTPKDMDPDDWVHQHGADAFLRGIDEATPLMQFHLQTKNAHKLRTAERSQFIRGIVKDVAEIPDGIIRDDLMRILSQKLNVNEVDLARAMQRERSRLKTRGAPPHEVSKESVEISFTTKVQKAQVELVRILASDDLDSRQIARENAHLDMFIEPTLKRLAEALMPQYGDIHYPSIIDSFTDETERKAVAKLLMNHIPCTDPQQTVKDCVHTLKTDPLRKKIQEARLQIRSLETEGKDVTPLIIEIAELQEELKALSG